MSASTSKTESDKGIHMNTILKVTKAAVLAKLNFLPGRLKSQYKQ